ncbi:MAG TPA: prolyl oligopeptidase family serine peptidase [Casimicrobiaceae bacterium]|nr:prolyl oligopeptidase family serine peptidase [Casimicrobiaceae bacterium]
MNHSTSFFLALAAFILSCAASLHAADLPVSPEPYFKHADFASLQLSPSGKLLAAIAPIGKRRGLVAIDIETRKPRVITALQDADVASFSWVNERRLAFTAQDLQAGLAEQYVGGGLFAIDVDGRNFKVLSPTIKSQIGRGNFVFRYTRLARALHDGSDDVLVYGNERNARHEDMYRMNTYDGRKTLLTDVWPGDPVTWVADRDGVVRAAITIEKGGLRSKSWWRPSADAPWRMIGDYGLRDPGIAPVAFDGDGSLIVSSDVGRETAALYRYDTTTMALGELLAAHPHADLETPIYDRQQKKIVGVMHDGGRPGVAYFDDQWARAAATVDRALPNHLNVLSRGAANHMLVSSQSDIDPGSWYLYDPDARKLEFLVARRSAIRAADMPTREPVRYKSRDGLIIPAILTLPKGREAKNLPLVVNVHGGPYVRGTRWTFNAEAAYLAALGYAVLEPDFRGSLGWGRKHFQAGWKQWGLAMQDDLIDGIDWLAASRTIDPQRVCIMGGSYGGYAVMMGLARDPERFRCGINIVGVTDIGLMFSVTWSDFSDSDFLKYAAKEMIGDPDKDAKYFSASSPLVNAAKIRAPVLMAYGGGDLRVPIVHGERMRDALERNKTPVEWVAYYDEGHGFLLEANRFDFYSRVAKFLRQHLGGK